MENKLDKDSFIRTLADTTGYTLGDTRRFLDCFIQVLTESIMDGIEINVRGLGKMYVQTLPARKGWKPIKGKIGQGQAMNYPEAKRVIFKLSKNLRDLVKIEVEDEDLEEV